MKKEKIYTVPNFISFYRLIAFPFILWLAIAGKEELFAILLIVNLITDVLDGFIARTFKCETELGARLDSLADIGTYILAIVGIFTFKYADIEPHIVLFITFISLFFITDIVALIKFRQFACFHLYSWKIGGYLQGGFFIALFSIGFFEFLFYFVMIWGILAFIEHIIIQMILPEMKSNVKGLYWVLKDKKQ
ncbi:MAG: CDP-alcohol phosphatidyltransferase [Odoribacter sp.]|nr:CDP-alcohol phosphatidyltransferase [Odoribacter sp.]